MNTKIIFKDEFSVIGKMRQGLSSECPKWIPEIWEEANAKFNEIGKVIKYDENGKIFGLWGAMNSVDEKFKRWDESGKYLAGCEVDNSSIAPENWTKWTIPAQTYLVATCSLETYEEVFNNILNDYLLANHMTVVGTVHEHYPEVGNSNLVELYFPIAKGICFCQSCAMPMTEGTHFGTNTDGTKNMEYCCYCYNNGSFGKDETMEEMIETCIPFSLEAGEYTDENTARTAMLEYFPNLKRWKKN